MQVCPTVIERLKVMLVDDDDSVRDAVTAILTRKGWEVDAYEDADKALGVLKSEAGRYDIVLADINMPGLNGMGFLRVVKDISPMVPVVMITGYPSIDLAVDAMKLGAVDFLAKPFKGEELEVIVRKAVGESQVSNAAGSASGDGSRAVASMPKVARRRLEDKIKELSILHTISETLDDVTDKEDIFRKTLDLALIITDSEGAFMLVVEQDDGEVAVRAASGFEDELIIGRRFSTSEEPFASVIKNKCYSYLMLEGRELSPLLAKSIVPGKRKSMLLAPMLINKEVVMMLGLTGSEMDGELSEDVISLLLNLTAKASLKLENVALSENIFASIIGTLNSLINALDARDTYTRDHSNRVTQYALKIARAYDCHQEVLDSISFAGPLHDIGKIGVRDDILLKKGSFTAEEREVMKSHVIRGEEILRPLNLLAPEKAVVLYHHERWDGCGYPNGLEGSDIPLVARIFSVADTFDAMTSTRPYRKALDFEVAREEIVRCSGTQFDPSVVDAFLNSGILTGEPEKQGV